MASLLVVTKQEQKGFNKSIKQAQSAAFLCQSVYFLMKSIPYLLHPYRQLLIYQKVCTLLIFYYFKNILWQRIQLLVWFIFLLIINTYLMLRTGKNPGYETKKVTQQQWQILLRQNKLKNFSSKSKKISDINQQQNTLPNNQQQKNINEDQEEASIIKFQSKQLNNQDSHLNQQFPINQIPQLSLNCDDSNDNLLIENYCRFCQCIKRNRMIHCYSCGKCVMKHDHHCPWIGACVGEVNHFMFLICLFAHTSQAITVFYIILKSLHFYEYYDAENETFSTEYGVFMLWSIFMVLYILFAGGLFFFHSYLVMSNLTTRELMSRKKCAYLRGIKGNPYDKGLINNIREAIWTDQKGRYDLPQIKFRSWRVQKVQAQVQKQRSCFSKIFKNEYYDCCC